jgi:hypothetical protein
MGRGAAGSREGEASLAAQERGALGVEGGIVTLVVAVTGLEAGFTQDGVQGAGAGLAAVREVLFTPS